MEFEPCVWYNQPHGKALFIPFERSLSMEKRKDNKGRLLKTGESQRKDGRYAYKYQDKNGNSKFLYSWRLNDTDPIPKGKRFCKSLREQEKELERDLMDGIDSSGKKMTLCQLYEKHNALKPNIRKNTTTGRYYLMEILKCDDLGIMTIDKIKPSDTKEWAIRMKAKGYSYQTINNYKRSLKASFYTALNDDLVRKNPFNWNLNDVLEDDTEAKTPLSDEQADNLLSFVQMDNVYQRHYRAIVMLLHTGLRISELCGLTVHDIDFEDGFIHITHQLTNDKDGYHITPPKTDSGVRDIPMTETVRKALQEEIETRKNNQQFRIDGYSNFIFLNQKGLPMYATAYSSTFRGIVKKYNKYHKENELPSISPHTLRHTFCTNMANKKMTPHTLQYIMGHRSLYMTLSYYTTVTPQSAMTEMLELSA